MLDGKIRTYRTGKCLGSSSSESKLRAETDLIQTDRKLLLKVSRPKR